MKQEAHVQWHRLPLICSCNTRPRAHIESTHLQTCLRGRCLNLNLQHRETRQSKVQRIKTKKTLFTQSNQEHRLPIFMFSLVSAALFAHWADHLCTLPVHVCVLPEVCTPLRKNFAPGNQVACVYQTTPVYVSSRCFVLEVRFEETKCNLKAISIYKYTYTHIFAHFQHLNQNTLLSPSVPSNSSFSFSPLSKTLPRDLHSLVTKPLRRHHFG